MPTSSTRKTAGNPFFVVEALAAGGDGDPGHGAGRGARARRAARARRRATLLEAVAVVPPQAELWLLEALAGDAVDAARRVPRLRACCAPSAPASRSGTSSPGSASRSRVAPHRAVALHRGRSRRSPTPPDGAPDLARLAHHAEAAGDAEAVLRFAPAAADAGGFARRAPRGGRAVRARAALRRRPAAGRARRAARAPLARVLPDRPDATRRSTALEEARRVPPRARRHARARATRCAGSREILWCPGPDGRVRPTRPRGGRAARGATARARARDGVRQSRADRCSPSAAGRGASTGPSARSSSPSASATRRPALHALDDDRAVECRSSDGSEQARAEPRAAQRARLRGAGRRVTYVQLVGVVGRRTGATTSRRRYLQAGHRRTAASAASSSTASTCSPRARARSSTRATGPRQPSPPTLVLASAAHARSRRASTRWSCSGSCARGAATPSSGRRSTRRGRWPSRPGSCRASRPVAAARAEAAWLAGDRDAVAAATEAVLALALERERRLGGRRAAPSGAGAPGSTSDPAGAAEPYALAARRRLGTRGRRSGASSAAPTRRRSRSPTRTTRRALRRALDELQQLGARPAAAIVARRLRERGARDLPRGPAAATRREPGGPDRARARGARARRRGPAQRRDRRAAGASPSGRSTTTSRAILRKLAVRTRGEASAEAVRLGLAGQIVGPARQPRQADRGGALPSPTVEAMTNANEKTTKESARCRHT